jgi:hypothetical protein
MLDADPHLLSTIWVYGQINDSVLAVKFTFASTRLGSFRRTDASSIFESRFLPSSPVS